MPYAPVWWRVFFGSTAPGLPLCSRLAARAFCFCGAWRWHRPVFDFLNQLNSQLNGDALACVWKAAGILILTQAVQDVCREAGHAALAGRVEMLGRLAALAAALPLVRQFAALAAGLLG